MAATHVINVDLAEVFETPDKKKFIRTLGWGDEVEVVGQPQPHLVGRTRADIRLNTAPGGKPLSALLALSTLVQRAKHRRVSADVDRSDAQVVVCVTPHDRGDVGDRPFRVPEPLQSCPRMAGRRFDEPRRLRALGLALADRLSRVHLPWAEPQKRPAIRVLEWVPQDRASDCSPGSRVA